jgi:epoxyqueuosine reductase
MLDATQCISYLTIELKGAIPEDLRAAMGSHIYGCDVCQDVCPYNIKFAQELREPAFAPRSAIGAKDARTLARDLLTMDDDAFREAFKRSPMKRAKLRGLSRNAAVVLGNIGDREDAPALAGASAEREPLVAEHANWALNEIEARRTALSTSLSLDAPPSK